uniref:NF-kappa-B inhibitor zeta-like n=1 Tax=Geotrypetes seraphini TaxID=260995 RepID=A0A6P8PHX5_GEOSA|nr:NF-kappa-B inhibitor zeta-like [Geotrypetes seraphini]XP_033775237.1 NF-kappa-B inhibitor zeta-like [Geotrypetes seraphini]
MNLVDMESNQSFSPLYQSISAFTDSEINSRTFPKQYVGVRVRMPVKELLRKIRSDRETDTNIIQRRVPKMSSQDFLGKTEALSYSREQKRPRKKKAKQILEKLEDLDSLAEILKDDLNRTNLCYELPNPHCYSESCPPGYLGEDNSNELKNNHVDTSQRASAVQPSYSFPNLQTSFILPSVSLSHNLLNTTASKLLEPSCLSQISGTESRSRHQNTLTCSFRDLPMLAPGNTQHLSVDIFKAYSEAGSNSTNPELRLEPSAQEPTPTDRNSSALSFFQFQLQREESFLRKIPVEILMAKDDEGNWLLHTAIVQGKRALVYALAERFSALNQIDVKDALNRTALYLAAERNQYLMVHDLISLGASTNERDSLGKTPLHLCAENGHLRVLEIFKKSKAEGFQIEVDAIDNDGLTPLHCAVLAHNAIVKEAENVFSSSNVQKLLSLRKALLLKGMSCLLQMGANAVAQELKYYKTAFQLADTEGNTEVLDFFQAHCPNLQDFLKEDCAAYALLNVAAGTIFPDLQNKDSSYFSTDFEAN